MSLPALLYTFVAGLLLSCSFSCSSTPAPAVTVALSGASYGLPYRWHSRQTTVFETQKQLFIGATSQNAGMGQLISSINNAQIFIHTPKNVIGNTHIDANGYDTRSVWDLNVVYQGSAPYLAAIMANTNEAYPDRYVHVVKVDGTLSFPFTAIKNSLNLDSVPCKICPAETTTDKVLVMAITASTTYATLDSQSTGACFRLFKINTGLQTLSEYSAGSNNGRLDVNTGSYTSGTSSLRIGKIASLRDMWWDSNLKRLYCAVHRTSDTQLMGVYALYLPGSVGSETIRPLTKEILDTQNSLTPYVHKVRTLLINPAASGPNLYKHYLIINGSTDPYRYNCIYALPLVNKNDPTDTDQGRIATKNDNNSKATDNNDSWFDQSNETYLAKRMVGGAPLPVNPDVPVTAIQTVDTEKAVYAATFDKAGNPCVFKSSAISTGDNGLTGWTAWQKVTDASLLTPIVGLGVSADAGDTNRKLLALTQDNSLIYRPDNAFATFATVPVRTPMGATQSPMWRARNVNIFDPVFSRFFSGVTTTGLGAESFASFLHVDGSTISKSTNTSGSILPELNDQPTWDMALYQAGNPLVVPHTTLGGVSINTGGNKLYLVTSSESLIELPTVAIKDNNNVASRIVKVTMASKKVGGQSTKMILAAIPDATKNNFEDGQENCIRTFQVDANKTALEEVTTPITFKFSLKDPAAQAGQDGGTLNFKSLEDVWWDDSLKRGYVGFTKDSDVTSKDPGLVMFGFSDDGNSMIAPIKLLGVGTFTSNTGYKHVFKVRTLNTLTDQTNEADNRSYLLINSSNDYVDTQITNRIYALPLVVSGANKGKIATSSTHATLAVDPNNTWKLGSNDALHIVGGAYLPTHQRSVITDMVISGKTLFVSVANPEGVVGATGVFMTQALTDDLGTLIAWTPWKKIGGLNSNVASLGYNKADDSLMMFGQDASTVQQASWKGASEISATNKNIQNLASLAHSLNEDFPSDRHGIYHVHSFAPTDGTTTSHLMAAIGYDRVALMHLGSKTSSLFGSAKYPHKLDSRRYHLYDSDAALQSIRSIYHAAASPGSTGWLFAAGFRGLAVLRIPGAGADAGKGWTALTDSLVDTANATTPALNDMTWLKIPDIAQPIYKVIIANDRVVLMTQKGLIGFIAAANKFTDASPAPLNTFSYTFSDEFEYMRDVTLVNGNVLLVGTTRGLYHMEVQTSSFTSPTPILYNAQLLGPIGTIAVTLPATNVANNTATVDVITAKVVDNQSIHYQFQLDLTGGSISDVGPLSLIRSFPHLEGSVVPIGDVQYYILPGKHLTNNGAINVIGSNTKGYTGVEVIKNNEHIGSIAQVAVDGSRLVTAGGTIYTYKI